MPVPPEALSEAPAGRFAPSPTGEFHLGNLRTAMLAWMFARVSGRRFLLRMEDLDRVRSGSEEIQLRDLEAVGLTFDGPMLRQSEHLPRYAAALRSLEGHVYECYCSRKDIAAAIEASASAPNAPGAPLYPGTCRHLTELERRTARARLAAQGRQPALRLCSEVAEFTVDDLIQGPTTVPVDDFILRRNDGAFAYNLVSVVDDAYTGVDQVVRGDDLLDSAGRHAYLATLLGLPVPAYAHVPLVLNEKGQRLAKRDGAVALSDLHALGCRTEEVTAAILASVNLPPTLEAAAAQVRTLEELVSIIPQEPWIFRGLPPRVAAQSSTGQPAPSPSR
jgi:glutamyl-tRNA synthetase